MMAFISSGPTRQLGRPTVGPTGLDSLATIAGGSGRWWKTGVGAAMLATEEAVAGGALVVAEETILVRLGADA
jgi:hypothetical protein